MLWFILSICETEIVRIVFVEDKFLGVKPSSLNVNTMITKTIAANIELFLFIILDHSFLNRRGK